MCVSIEGMQFSFSDNIFEPLYGKQWKRESYNENYSLGEERCVNLDAI